MTFEGWKQGGAQSSSSGTRPEMGIPQGLVPAGPHGGALEAGAESQREPAAVGLSPRLLREMT